MQASSANNLTPTGKAPPAPPSTTLFDAAGLARARVQGTEGSAQNHAPWSMGIRGHGGSATCGGRKIVNPLFANRLSTLHQLGTWFFAMLNDDHNSGVEHPLRFVNSGQSRAFSGNHVLNRYFAAVCLENKVAINIFACRNQISQNEKVENFLHRHQTHQI